MAYEPLAEALQGSGVSASAFNDRRIVPKINYKQFMQPQQQQVQQSQNQPDVKTGALDAATKKIDDQKLSYSMDRGCGSTDCSAFTQNIYKDTYGKDIGGWTGSQQKAGTGAAVGDSQYGDLVFFNTDKGKRTGGIGHVGYDNGNGTFTHFSSSNGGGVRTTPFNGYFPVEKRRRIL